MRDSSFWNVIVPRVMGTYANGIFLVLWVGFITALVVNREWLDVFWKWAQALPMIPRIIVWVLFLPIMVGLWIWESTWPVLGRLVGFAGIVAWTLLAVYSLIRDFRQILFHWVGVGIYGVIFDQVREQKEFSRQSR